MSLSVNDLYNGLGGTSTMSTAALKSTSSANQLTSQIKEAGTEEEMMSACEDFEAYLLQKMFESMEKSAKLFSDDEDENEYTEMFGDQMYQSMADTMVSCGKGLGIAQMLYESMTRNAGTSAVKEGTEEVKTIE
ncbi:MAG: rod-binding protein [Eubacterium sp.]